MRDSTITVMHMSSRPVTEAMMVWDGKRVMQERKQAAFITARTHLACGERNLGVFESAVFGCQTDPTPGNRL